MRPTVHVVPHTHWDREWYHTAARFGLRLAAMVDDTMSRLEDGNLPAFLLDGQGIVLDDYLAMRPEAGPRLAAHLGAGRLECGPWYVLADNLLVSGEALIRNLLEGRRTVRRHGGRPMKVGYAPDTFGHPGILPTLFAGFGIRTAVTWRGFGGENSQEKDLYRWLGPDGSESVMIHLPPQGYESGRVGEWMSGASGRAGGWAALRALLEGRARAPHWLILNGADHHAPQTGLRAAVRALSRIERDCRFVIGSLGDYSKAVEAWARRHADELPVVVGELRRGQRAQWVLQGTHGSRLELKQANAGCQRLLERVAEPLAALAGMVDGGRWMVKKAPRDDLHAAWRTLLENHPHDSICGTSSDAVHREMITRFNRCGVMGDEIVQRAADAAIGHDPDAARAAGRETWKPALLVFNPAPRPRSGIFEADVALFAGDISVGPGSAGRKPRIRRPRSLVVRGADGAALAVQELSREDGYDRIESPHYYPDCDAVEWRRVAIAVDDLPPLGLTALRVEESVAGRRSKLPLRPVTATDFGLENEALQLRVESDGTIALLDRASERSAHGLGALECVRDAGDSYTSAPRGANLTPAPDAVAVRVVREGPLVGQLEVVRRWDDADIEVTMRVRLDAGARHLVVTTDFWNVHPDRRVRLAFPLGEPLRRVVADGAFGPVERPLRPVRRRPGDTEAPDPCAPMQRYVSVAGASGGLTVFTDGLPQYEARTDGTVLVTLLRSFTQLSRRDLRERPGHAGWPTFTPDGAHIGLVRSRLAVMLHDPESLDARDALEAAADAFLAPPIGLMRRALLALGPASRGPELKGKGLVFSAMKPAEAGKGVVLRCYNDRREAVRGAWHVGTAFRTATRCRLDETPIGKVSMGRGVIAFEAAAREVVTILVR